VAAGWSAVVDSVRAQNRILGHFIAETRVLGLEGTTLVLEVEPNGRALLEHRDNRALLVNAFAVAYGRRLEYRVVSAAAASPAEPPPGFDDADDPGAAAPPAEAATPEAPAPSPATTGGRRKQPGDLSPGARSAMVWLDGEIVGPPRPTPS
jgi:hypothetical protein